MAEMAGITGAVDPQMLIRVLSGKITALTIENAIWQVRAQELEAQLQEMAEAGKADVRSGEVEK